MESLIGQFADIMSSPNDDDTGLECDSFSVGVTFKAVAGRIGGLGTVSRPSLQPCVQTVPIATDFCCPSEWLAGKTRMETCDTPEKVIKAARFDLLSGTVQIPVPGPAGL